MISNGSGVVVLTDIQTSTRTDKHTHKQTLLKTIPSLLSCAGGINPFAAHKRPALHWVNGIYDEQRPS